MDKATTPIISFVANSGTGKTTLLEKLVREIKSRGYTLSVIKHDAHKFEIDKPGKDSYRMTQAGADTVVITSNDKTALIHQTKEMMEMDEIIKMMPQTDILLTEGFRFSSGHPRIEVYRRPHSTELISPIDALLAVASNVPLDVPVPVFDIDDAKGITDFIEEYVKDFREKLK